MNDDGIKDSVTHHNEPNFTRACALIAQPGSRGLTFSRKVPGLFLNHECSFVSRTLDACATGILLVGSQGQVQMANRRARKLLALDEEAVRAGRCYLQDWHFTRLGSPGSQAVSLLQALTSGEPLCGARFTYSLPGGRQTRFSVHGAPWLVAGSQKAGWVVTLEDIEEQWNLEAQWRQSQKMETLGYLAAGVVHDTNNVLSLILGQVELLREVMPQNREVSASLRQISAAADSAARFIQQLLMFSRQQAVQLKPLDLNGVVRNLATLLPRLLRDNIRLEIRSASNLPLIHADLGMMEQLVMNLAINARDAMPNGGHVRITTKAVSLDSPQLRQRSEVRPGKSVCLEMADTGCGMTPEILEHIFDPFFSTKAAGCGTGVGLATIHNIVKQHGGWIEVESKVSRGSIFKVYLPEAYCPPTSTAASEVQLELICRGSETILLVEDEPGLRQTIAAVLREYGYHVLEAADAVDALRLWNEQKGNVDLLLIDLVLPGDTNGHQLAGHLKRRRPQLRILYNSGYSPEVIGSASGDVGGSFIPKPCRPQQLVRMIRHCLDTDSNQPPLALPA